MSKAAIYLSGQGTEDRALLLTTLKSRGFTLEREYAADECDDSALKKLLSDAGDKLFTCVFVANFNVLARSLSGLLDILSQFNRLGIDLVSLEESIDTTKVGSESFFATASIFLDFDRASSSKQIKAGLLKAVQNGKQLGRPEKDPDAVKRVIRLREDGLSLREIARAVDMSASGVLKILRRCDKKDGRPDVLESPPEAPVICQLKVYITLIKPQIWRRVLIPSTITLEKLGLTIEKLFNWTDEIDHEFVPRDSRGFGYSLNCDERTFRFCDLNLKPGDGMLFEYGVDLTHEVTFEKVVPFDEAQVYPVCSGGSMAAPPEECYGAMEYIDAFKKRKTLHFRSDWSKNFDRQHFDLAEVNNRLGVKFLGKDTSPTKARTVAKPEEPVYQLKITICGVLPEIWRRIQVKESTSLSQLSRIIDVLFDWSGDHLHRFGLSSFYRDSAEIGNEGRNLGSMGLKTGDTLLYEYDFGDSWLHEIILEEITPLNKGRTYPVCLTGKNAGPPEDCGGADMFMNDRNFLSRRKGKPARARRGQVSWSQKEFYKENYRGYDPDKFDKDSINKDLRERFTKSTEGKLPLE